MAYGDDAALVAYLALTGRALPVGYLPATARQYGSMYVDLWEQDYLGTAVTYDASFPRDLWPAVPDRVEHAAYEAGFAYAGGLDIFGTGGTAGGQVTREKVDVIEVQYAGPQDGQGWWDANRYVLPLAYALLLPFFRRKTACGFGGASAFIV